MMLMHRPPPAVRIKAEGGSIFAELVVHGAGVGEHPPTGLREVDSPSSRPRGSPRADEASTPLIIGQLHVLGLCAGWAFEA